LRRGKRKGGKMKYLGIKGVSATRGKNTCAGEHQRGNKDRRGIEWCKLLTRKLGSAKKDPNSKNPPSSRLTRSSSQKTPGG